MSHVFNTCHWSPWSRLEGSTADTSDASKRQFTQHSVIAFSHLGYLSHVHTVYTHPKNVLGGMKMLASCTGYTTRFYLIAYPSLKYKYPRPEFTWAAAQCCTVPLAFNWEIGQIVHIWQTTYLYDFNLAYQYDVAPASKLPPRAWCQKKLDPVRLWFSASVI